MPVRSIYNQSLGKAVAKKAQPKKRYKIHVISSADNVWSVVAEGTLRPVRNFRNQRQAISFAKSYAVQKAINEVIVHAKDGAIRTSYSI